MNYTIFNKECCQKYSKRYCVFNLKFSLHIHLYITMSLFSVILRNIYKLLVSTKTNYQSYRTRNLRNSANRVEVMSTFIVHLSCFTVSRKTVLIFFHHSNDLSKISYAFYHWVFRWPLGEVVVCLQECVLQTSFSTEFKVLRTLIY